MIEYISTHIPGLTLAFLIYGLPLLTVVGWWAISAMRERAHTRGYDEAWEIAIRAQNAGRKLV